MTNPKIQDARASSREGEENEYLLGTHAEEYARLGFQHRVWGATTFELWEQAGFAPRQRLLDVGCGPGFASVDLAYLVGREGKVLAADASARFLKHVEHVKRALDLPQIETWLGDVEDFAPPAASFDGAFARWLLCFVPHPERVIANVARALRPGGTFAVFDYYRYGSMTLSPRSRALERLAEAVEESWRRAGGDLDVGGRLPHLFAESGLEVRHVKNVVRTARPGSSLWRWPDLFFSTYAPKLVEMGLLTPDERDAFLREWRERSNDPDAFFSTPPNYAIVGVKR